MIKPFFQIPKKRFLAARLLTSQKCHPYRENTSERQDQFFLLQGSRLQTHPQSEEYTSKPIAIHLDTNIYGVRQIGPVQVYKKGAALCWTWDISIHFRWHK